MNDFYIKNEHLVLQSTYDLCRFCLCVKQNMRRIPHENLPNSNIPAIYLAATTLELQFRDDYPEYICPKCEKNLLLVAKIRKDLLKVDAFWKTFLQRHSDYHLNKKKTPPDVDCSSHHVQLSEGAKQITTTEPVLHIIDHTVLHIIDHTALNGTSTNFLESHFITNNNPLIDQTNVEQQVPLEHEIVQKIEESYVFCDVQENDPSFVTAEPKTPMPIEEIKIESYELIDDVKDEEHKNEDDNIGTDDGFVDDANNEVLDEKPIIVDSQLANDKLISDYYMRHKNKYPKQRNINGITAVCGKDKPFKCFECDEEFDEISSLHEHTFDVHSIVQMSCDECNQIFVKKGELRLHVKTHIEKCCEFCKRYFSTISRWKTHMKENHDGGNKTFTCNLCNKTLKNSDSFKKHISLTHSGNMRLVCHICGKTCKNSQYLKVHLRTHVEKAKAFKCSYCEKEFKLKYSKKLHERVHTGERPYMCDICGFSFTQRGLLQRHKELHNRPKQKKKPRLINVEHGNVKCDICDATFSNIINMKSHLDKKHKHLGTAIWEDKLNTTCMKCHLTFTDTDKLNEHKKTHLEFICHICKQRYSNARSLEHHISKHADKERPFKCDVCGAAYIRKSHLAQHYQGMHTNIRPHVCMFCSKAFAQTFQLKTHIKLVHHKEKPYKCDECDKAFSTSVQLNQHKQYHTGKFLYQCLVCEKCFISGSALTKHTRNSKSCRGKLPSNRGPLPPPLVPISQPPLAVPEPIETMPVIVEATEIITATPIITLALPIDVHKNLEQMTSHQSQRQVYYTSI